MQTTSLLQGASGGGGAEDCPKPVQGWTTFGCDGYHRLNRGKYVRFTAGSDVPHKEHFFSRFGAKEVATANPPPTESRRAYKR